jgi:hypothetical protein
MLRAGSSSVRPLCSREAVQAAHRNHGAGHTCIGQRRLGQTVAIRCRLALPQTAPRRLPIIALLTCDESVTQLGQIIRIAVQVATVRRDSVRRHAALDGEVIEVGLDQLDHRRSVSRGRRPAPDAPAHALGEPGRW